MRTTKNGLNDAMRRRSRRRRESLSHQSQAQRRTQPMRNDLAPQLKLELRPVEALSAAGRRLRKSERAQVERVKSAIATLGFCAPVLIHSNGEIIDGHVRVEAASELGLSEVSCIVIDHLDDAEVRTLRLALNRLPETGVWDLDALKLEFAELVELDAPLEVTGFTLPEIDLVLLDVEPDGEDEDEAVPSVRAEAVSKPGDVWQLGPHRLACGDARDPAVYAALMDEGEEAQLILTDVPFNVPIAGHVTSGEHREFAMASGEMSQDEFAAFNRQWMEASTAWLCDGGLAATFIDWRSVALIINGWEATGLALLNLVVWGKPNAGMGSLWRSQHELLPVAKKGSAPHRNNVALGRNGRWRSNLWTYPGASSFGSSTRDDLKNHPTPKNVAMLQDALLDVTDREDIVMDPFLGSGSLLLAAEKTGRICRGIELDPLYVDLAIRRWTELAGQQPRRLTGEADDEPRREAEPDGAGDVVFLDQGEEEPPPRRRRRRASV